MLLRWLRVFRKPPGERGTRGEIETVGLYEGAVYYGGHIDLQDDGTVDPLREKWWIHNWHCSLVFPPAPETGWLSYRFYVDTIARLRRAEMISGLFNTFVTVINPDNPYESDNFSGFPNWVVLPSDNPYRIFGDYGMPVSSSIAVEKGQSLTLNVYLGVIISIASGLVMLYPTGGLGIRKLLPQGQTITSNTLGKIEYHFYSQKWINAVRDYIIIAS